MPKVSVIIPSYNHEKFIKECIQSVLDQTFQDFEIIITDDGSRDRSLEIIKSFTDRRIKLFTQAKNLGFSMTANNCIRQSKGKYIAMLNSEDAWTSRKLELQVRYLDRHPTVGAVFGKVIWIDEESRLITDPSFPDRKIFEINNRNRFRWLRDFFFHGNCLCHSSSLMRRECYTQIGMYNLSLVSFQDFDLWIRLCLKHEISVMNQELVLYRRIGEGRNPREGNPKNPTETRFVYKQLLSHYLTIRTTRNILRIFPNAARYGRLTPDLIPYFVGRKAIDAGLDFMSLWGLEVIYDLLKDDKVAHRLERQCGFTRQDFMKLTGKGNSFKIFEAEKMVGKEQTVPALMAQVQALNAQVQEITSSRTWKIYQSLDRLRHSLAPRGGRRERQAKLALRAVRSLRYRYWVPFARMMSRKQAGERPGTRFAERKTPPGMEDLKRTAQHLARVKLGLFLASDALLELPAFSHPVVSIILLLNNRAEMTLQCLESLAESGSYVPFEVVIIDNASTDATSSLISRIHNIQYIRNPRNLGFGPACNQAADLAVGKYLLFLNNDTQLLGNSLKVLVGTIEDGDKIGAVGGKLIFPDGTLQEAGSIIWQDGSCCAYGRNDNPFKPEYCYTKDVDFCSGALLLTPRKLFLSLGKFDPIYEPAYYEDADYCLRLWAQGYRVIYQPMAVAIHHEFGSSDKKIAVDLQLKNRLKFSEKWNQTLTSFYPPEQANLIFSREHKDDSLHVLLIDDRIPDYRLGSGYPRTYRILQVMAELGYRLTFLPLQFATQVPDIAQSLQAKGIEILYTEDDRKIDIGDFLMSRQDYYDVIFVSRPHNMQVFKKYIKDFVGRAAVVYDAEALFANRELEFNELMGWTLTEAQRKNLIQTEVGLVKDAAVISVVSKLEKEVFEEFGTARVQVLGDVLEPEPTPAPFEERKDILFVGGILGSPSPNEDSVLYFVNQILPLVRHEMTCEFNIVGTNLVPSIWKLESDFVHIIGKVDDLNSFYNRSRIFVAPTRYSAGIPIKLLEAAAHGLPVVATPLLAQHLGWKENRDILVGRNAEDFAHKVVDLYSDRDLFYSLRRNAMNRIREEYSHQKFAENLQSLFRLAFHTSENPKAIPMY